MPFVYINRFVLLVNIEHSTVYVVKEVMKDLLEEYHYCLFMNIKTVFDLMNYSGDQ